MKKYFRFNESKMSEVQSGQIRVGRSKRSYYPSYPGFTPIIVLTKNISSYGQLSPYYLRNEQGQLLEDEWQFSKAYDYVPEVHVPYSFSNPRIVWEWPTETHIDADGNLTKEYWNWRRTGKNHSEPVRAPVGWKHLKNCRFSLEKDEPISETNPRLDYIESRKRIYFPHYMKAVIKEPLFQELKKRLQNGENLLIIDVDGPHQESLAYYQKKYGVNEKFVEQDSIEVIESNLTILLNDERHPFGHGYCLAWALLNYA